MKRYIFTVVILMGANQELMAAAAAAAAVDDDGGRLTPMLFGQQQDSSLQDPGMGSPVSPPALLGLPGQQHSSLEDPGMGSSFPPPAGSLVRGSSLDSLGSPAPYFPFGSLSELPAAAPALAVAGTAAQIPAASGPRAGSKRRLSSDEDEAWGQDDRDPGEAAAAPGPGRGVARRKYLRFSEQEDALIKEHAEANGSGKWGELAEEINKIVHGGAEIRKAAHCRHHWWHVLCPEPAAAREARREAAAAEGLRRLEQADLATIIAEDVGDPTPSNYQQIRETMKAIAHKDPELSLSVTQWAAVLFKEKKVSKESVKRIYNAFPKGWPPYVCLNKSKKFRRPRSQAAIASAVAAAPSLHSLGEGSITTSPRSGSKGRRVPYSDDRAASPAFSDGSIGGDLMEGVGPSAEVGDGDVPGEDEALGQDNLDPGEASAAPGPGGGVARREHPRFSAQEDALIKAYVEKNCSRGWRACAEEINRTIYNGKEIRTQVSCRDRWNRCLCPEGTATREDQFIIRYVLRYGDKSWLELAKAINTHFYSGQEIRNGTYCSGRWLNKLQRDLWQPPSDGTDPLAVLDFQTEGRTLGQVASMAAEAQAARRAAEGEAARIAEEARRAAAAAREARRVKAAIASAVAAAPSLYNLGEGSITTSPRAGSKRRRVPSSDDRAASPAFSDGSIGGDLMEGVGPSAEVGDGDVPGEDEALGQDNLDPGEASAAPGPGGGVARREQVRFSEQEDAFMKQHVELFGPREWDVLAYQTNNGIYGGRDIRTAASCHDHWYNVLSPEAEARRSAAREAREAARRAKAAIASAVAAAPFFDAGAGAGAPLETLEALV